MSQNIIIGCQANGGARAGRAPPRSANELLCQYDIDTYAIVKFSIILLNQYAT